MPTLPYFVPNGGRLFAAHLPTTNFAVSIGGHVTTWNKPSLQWIWSRYYQGKSPTFQEIRDLCEQVLEKLREQALAEREAKLAEVTEAKKLAAWKKANAVASKKKAEAAQAKADLIEKQYKATEQWTVADLQTGRRIKEV